MNNLEALIIVRGSARVSAQMRTRQGIAAGKVVDRKIQSLMRKKAWRHGGGSTPVHMGDEDFAYKIPDDPMTSALRALVDAQRAWVSADDQDSDARIRAAMATAEDVLLSLENTEVTDAKRSVE